MRRHRRNCVRNRRVVERPDEIGLERPGARIAPIRIVRDRTIDHGDERRGKIRSRIAQPHSGPGLVVGGPALDAGDRQVRRVLLQGEQLGPAQADGGGIGGEGFRGGRSPFGIGPNSALIFARAASESNPPTTTSAALFGWYHLS